MSSETPDANQQDLPWNDSPADSDSPAGAAEPSPAEVDGDADDDQVVDTASPRFPDRYQRDTLDQRLAEEMPDRPGAAEDRGVQLVDPERGGGYAEVGEGDSDDIADRDSGMSAEESAVHVRDRI